MMRDAWVFLQREDFSRPDGFQAWGGTSIRVVDNERRFANSHGAKTIRTSRKLPQ
ncbi:hypothetical protein GCM10027021_36170 [Dyella kyungheensis]